MPAVTRDENGTDAVEEPVEDAEFQDGERGPSVTDHLDMALTVARDQDMSAAELMGLFFYYAHSIAEGYRQDIINNQPPS